MKKTINNITINYEEEGKNFIDEVFNYLLSQIEKIYSFFNIYINENITIYIVPTKKELDTQLWNNTNTKPLPWIVGFSNYNKNKAEIFLLSFNDYKNSRTRICSYN